MLTVYSTETCGYCRKLKAYLDERGVPYTVVDVAASPSAAQALRRVSGQSGVPVTVADNGAVIVGFDRPRIDALLDEIGAAH